MLGTLHDYLCFNPDHDGFLPPCRYAPSQAPAPLLTLPPRRFVLGCWFVPPCLSCKGLSSTDLSMVQHTRGRQRSVPFIAPWNRLAKFVLSTTNKWPLVVVSWSCLLLVQRHPFH